MAIKVNGTTVIDDSRALSNIASVDATTVAALENAGVGGGAFTEINPLTSFSGVSSITLTLPSAYSVHLVYFFDVDHNDPGNEDFQMRLGNSSGSIITSTTYPQGRSGTSGSTKAWIQVQDNVTPSGGMPAAVVEIFSAAESCQTFVRTSAMNTTIGFSQFELVTGATENTAQRNANAYFFFDASPSMSGKYLMVGY